MQCPKNTLGKKIKKIKTTWPLRTGVGKLWPVSQIQLLPISVNKVNPEHCPLEVYGWLSTVRAGADVSSCNRDHIVCRAENIYHLAIHRKSILTPSPEGKKFKWQTTVSTYYSNSTTFNNTSNPFQGTQSTIYVLSGLHANHPVLFKTTTPSNH